MQTRRKQPRRKQPRRLRTGTRRHPDRSTGSIDVSRSRKSVSGWFSLTGGSELSVRCFFSSSIGCFARPSLPIVPRGPSARVVHAAGSFGCSESGRASFPPPLRVFRIIMNEQEGKKEGKKRKKSARSRVRRGCEAARAGYQHRAIPFAARSCYRMTLSSHASVAHSSRRGSNGSRILDNPLANPPIADTFLPHPLSQPRADSDRNAR